MPGQDFHLPVFQAPNWRTPPDYNYIADVVSRAQQGDSDAFAELYAATYQREYIFSLKYLKDSYLAQDALQETYLIAFKGLANLREPSLAISWLNQINFRVCYKMQQKQQSYSDSVDYDSETVKNSMSLEDTPEDNIVRIDTEEYVMNQVLKLPFTESQVIILKYYKNMNNAEIAELMDISRSSVKRYLRNGLDRLRSVLQQ